MKAHEVDGAAAHRLLRSRLRGLRDRAQLTQHQVAEAMDWSVSKAVRIENGDVRVSVSDLRHLFELYDVKSNEDQDQMLAMARAARQQPWRAFRDVHSPAFLRYLSYELSASQIWEVAPHFVPGLYQTEDYPRALLNGAEVTLREPQKVNRLVQARQRRQQLLALPHPPSIVAYLDESVISRAVGSPSIMSAQLLHLETLTQSAGVRFRIVPHTAGLYPGLRTGFVRLAFEDGEQGDVIYIESSTGDVVTQDDDTAGSPKRHAHDLALYVKALDHLDAVALPEDMSLTLIRDTRLAMTQQVTNG
jgi:transcriptional regulator with XRE-family HTH domain